MRYLFLIICLVFASVTNAAKSETYLVIGLGNSHLDNPANIWHDFPITVNAGYESTDNERAPAYEIGLGKRYSWGAVEWSYHRPGPTSSYAGYPYDPDAPGSSPNGCTWPCTPTQWVYHYGRTEMLHIKALPEYRLYRDSVALVGMLGITAHRSEFRYVIANEAGNPYERGFSTAKQVVSSGLSPLFGGGLRFGNVVISWSRASSVAAENRRENGKGNFQRVDSLMLYYRTDL